ncbi:MAG: hypothetical protein OXI91_15875 [Chloroflexota bacterium]|nr:hypothetical protein [Chloroflexota bacterium]
MPPDRLHIELALEGLPPDAVLEFELQEGATGLSLASLLEEVFPRDEAARMEVEESFDLRLNPDVPEIYGEFLAVVRQYRAGLCSLSVSSTTGQDLSPTDLVDDLVAPGPPGSFSVLSLSLAAQYDPLEYAGDQGYDAGEPDLLHWLLVCLTMYFIDKHESSLPAQESLDQCPPLASAVDEILSRNLVETGDNPPAAAITPEGRRFIGDLLAETEQLIDSYDLFKDACWDKDTGQALFGTGQGEDLRVEVFIADSIDPVRAVFLLRLYDGSLDLLADRWPEAAADIDLFNNLLLPVVDRSVTESELLEEIIEQGMELLESQQERIREETIYRRAARSALADGC